MELNEKYQEMVGLGFLAVDELIVYKGLMAVNEARIEKLNSVWNKAFTAKFKVMGKFPAKKWELIDFQNTQAELNGYSSMGHAEDSLRYGTEKERQKLTTMLCAAQEAYAVAYYPIQDHIWPSRRWNAEEDEYIDLSGY